MSVCSQSPPVTGHEASLLRRALQFPALGLFFLIGPVMAQTAISVDGVVESTMGGFKFPDGTIQDTAAGQCAVGVPDSGQQDCWDSSGDPIPCSGTGQDGELQAGIPWPTPRFADNDDGTVTDRLTGLMWLQDADCFGTVTWANAFLRVAQLNQGGTACTNYAPGTFSDWRLPNIRELAALADYGQVGPALPRNHPFIGVHSAFYWSSSTFLTVPSSAWNFNVHNGIVFPYDTKAGSLRVWPVRSDQ